MDNLSDIERAERIDRYLAGKLSTEEAQAFENTLAQDQEFRQEYENIKMVRALAQDYGLREEVRSIRQSMRREMAKETTATPTSEPPTLVDTTPSEPDNVRPLFRPLSAYAGRIAAGVAVLLVGFIMFQYATLSNEDLYAEKVMPYQIAASRSVEVPDATRENRLEQQYRSQQLDEVMDTYEQMDNPSLMAMFLAGNAYLQEGQTDQAIDAFNKIVVINGSQGINRFEEDAQYYLALSYLKADRLADALPLLEEINDNPEHSYHSFVNDYYLWKVKFLNRIS